MPRAQTFLLTASLLPLPFLVLGPVLGAGFALVAMGYLTVFTFLIDQSVHQTGATAGINTGLETVLARSLPLVLAIAHFLLLPLAVMAVAAPDTGWVFKCANFAAFGLFFGTISAANAHELIHRGDRLHHSLGKWVFISMLFGHHVSAHLHVHHPHVATPLDPNSARQNDGVYRFFKRAWLGSFRAGYEIEKARLLRLNKPVLGPENPYSVYILGAALATITAWFFTGWAGVVAYFGLCMFATAQVLLSDYVQHYGLQRRLGANGRYEPLTTRHSWNAPHVFSAAIMLNAPRHSDHHAHPRLPYYDLQSRPGEMAPMLPFSLPMMSFIALTPRLWKKLMNPRVAEWQRDQDVLLAKGADKPGGMC